MKNIFGVIAILFATFLLPSCSGVSVNGGEEAVFVVKPYFFGSGGVLPTVPIR